MTALGTQTGIDKSFETFHVTKQFLSKQEIGTVCKYGKGTDAQPATVDGETETRTKERRCTVALLSYKCFPDIWDRLCEKAYTVGKNTFGLDVDPDSPKEKMNFLVYAKGDYYNWHYDLYGTRKVTGLIVLNNGFIGGEHQQLLDTDPTTIKLTPGDLLLFPSYIVHRCKKIKKGRRVALSAWFHGKRLT